MVSRQDADASQHIFQVYSGLLGALATGSNRWTEHEFAGRDWGDVCLDKRAKILTERLSANQTASIPMACESWSETCAGYRFLGNPDGEWQDMKRGSDEFSLVCDAAGDE